MRNDRSYARNVKYVLIIVVFVTVVALKSWTLLKTSSSGSDKAGSAGAESALVETTVSGRLELDLSDAGWRLDQVLSAHLADDPKPVKTIEALIRRQVFMSYLQTIFREPAMALPTDAPRRKVWLT